MRWRTVKLGDEVTIKGGGTPSRYRPEFFQGNIPWATIKDLTGLYLGHTQEYITKEALDSSAANLIPVGNVILATRVGLGKVAINTIDVAINQDLKALFCSPRLEPKYLVYYLTSLSASIERQGVGATVKGITLKQVENWPLPLPPPSEQRQIVEILDQADTLRKKRAEADAKAERILPALFIKMFGDPVTNPKGWNVSSLGEVTKIIHRYPTFYGQEYVEVGVPVVRISDILPDHILSQDMSKYAKVPKEFSDQFPLTLLESKDIVMAVRGDTTGKIGLVPDDLVGANLSPNLIRISPDLVKVRPYYLFVYLLLADQNLNLFITNTAKKSITAKNLKSIPVLVPPVSLQECFEQQVSDILKIDGNRLICSSQIKQLFSLLLHRAFSGNLTSKWREAHMKELLVEMEEQARSLDREKRSSQVQELLFNN